jgi:ribonuclease J
VPAPNYINQNRNRFEVKHPPVAIIPPLADDTIRIIPLGGVEEVGKNMTIIETKNSIVIIDAGVQYSQTKNPGIDFIIPNTRYLEDRKNKIKAVILTHSGIEFTGALPYMAATIGNTKVYARKFTCEIVNRRVKDFDENLNLKFQAIADGESIVLDDISIKFYAAKNDTPDAMNIIIETKFGDIVHATNSRIENNSKEVSTGEEARYKEFEGRDVLCLLADSINSESANFSLNEKEVYAKLEEKIKRDDKRVIFSAFSSQIERIAFIIHTAERHEKKVVLDGKNIKMMVAAGMDAGIISSKSVINIEDMKNFDNNKVVIISSGGQNDENSLLQKAVLGTHKYITLTENDIIILVTDATSNQRKVQVLKDSMSRLGSHITHYKQNDINSNTYGSFEDLSFIHRKINPKFFIPILGFHYMLRVHADIEKRRGSFENHTVIPDNGMVIEIQNAGKRILHLSKRAPSDLVVVDGAKVGRIQDVVMRDRETLGEQGIFVIISILDSNTRKLKQDIEISSRGFVYLKNSNILLDEAKEMSTTIINSYLDSNKLVDMDELKNNLQESLAKLLMQKTAKKPVIIPIIITI